MTLLDTYSDVSSAKPWGEHLDEAVRALDRVLSQSAGRLSQPAYFELLGNELRRVHAQFRIHQATDYPPGHADPEHIPAPDVAEDLFRLRDEHSRLLGDLDRLIRSVDSMIDRVPEDTEVFLARARELVWVIRRHLVEEDRLFMVAVWRDTGGES